MDILSVHMNFQRKRIPFVSRVKIKIIIDAPIWLFMEYFLNIIYVDHIVFFPKKLWAHIEYPDIQAQFFFPVFDILNFVSYAFLTIGSYVPESQNTTPVFVYVTLCKDVWLETWCFGS
jgi:hypothetical protein